MHILDNVSMVASYTQDEIDILKKYRKQQIKTRENPDTEKEIKKEALKYEKAATIMINFLKANNNLKIMYQRAIFQRN